MSLLTLVGVGALGGLGAVARFAVQRAVTARRPGAFPAGTLVVNLTGALVAGVLAGAALPDEALLLAGGGLLGSYTTFSAWMLETQRAPRGVAVANVVLSLVLGLAAVAAGRALAG